MKNIKKPRIQFFWNFAMRLHKTHSKQKKIARTTKFHVCRAFYVGARQSFKKIWILASLYLSTTNTCFKQLLEIKLVS
jgi:hypothetical protein